MFEPANTVVPFSGSEPGKFTPTDARADCAALVSSVTPVGAAKSLN
jgi:hypothetical protein